MAVLYDCYDYPSYWIGREYENQADKLAIKKFLKNIKKKESLIDIAGGFGRLASFLAPDFKNILLVDYSEGLLKEAKKYLSAYKNIKIKKGECEKLPVKNDAFDVALMVRVVHHLKKPGKAFQEAYRVLKPGGFFILEFANKIHLKAVIKAIFKKKLGYLLSHLPENISTHKDVLFLNYHPAHIKSLLLANDFKIIQTLSVSNFRHPICKKIIPLKCLCFLESKLQSIGSKINFGPSVFILARK